MPFKLNRKIFDDNTNLLNIYYRYEVKEITILVNVNLKQGELQWIDAVSFKIVSAP